MQNGRTERKLFLIVSLLCLFGCISAVHIPQTRNCDFGILDGMFTYRYVLIMDNETAINQFTTIEFNIEVLWPNTGEFCIGDTLTKSVVYNGDEYDFAVKYVKSYTESGGSRLFQFEVAVFDAIWQPTVTIDVPFQSALEHYNMRVAVNHYNDPSVPLDSFILYLDGPSHQTVPFGHKSAPIAVHSSPPVDLSTTGLSVYAVLPEDTSTLGQLETCPGLATGTATYELVVGLELHYCYLVISYRSPAHPVQFCVHRKKMAPSSSATKVVRGLDINVKLDNVNKDGQTTLQHRFLYSTANSNPLDLYDGDALTLLTGHLVDCADPRDCHPQSIKLAPVIDGTEYTMKYAVMEYHIPTADDGHDGAAFTATTALQVGCVAKLVYNDLHLPGGTEPRSDWGNTTLTVTIELVELGSLVMSLTDLVMLAALIVVIVGGCSLFNCTFISNALPLVRAYSWTKSKALKLLGKNQQTVFRPYRLENRGTLDPFADDDYGVEGESMPMLYREDPYPERYLDSFDGFDGQDDAYQDLDDSLDLRHSPMSGSYDTGSGFMRGADLASLI
ncbi:hypothetical protein J8273_4099 [Carpediemonas membranifera]|uniref:Uncharacterized protein n=1 Tax=Carpediemonas membranifera TaxID=201153 RepID=A0A8J6E017_9EUKA|nr:hypothetical protein J8273_4099 [Carpediemonas membranifera]|eukprot:KAG9394434.1 hypothetical protein J8273_4099 [Carpediemonas membranifera]